MKKINFVVAWNETVKKYCNLLAQRAGRRKTNHSRYRQHGREEMIYPPRRYLD
jgi:hypothetical protein